MTIENGRTDYRFEDDRVHRSVAHLRWKCDEASGVLLADSSVAGPAVNGTSESSVWGAGRTGLDVCHVLVNEEKALFATNLDGTGLDSTHDWEFSAWVNVADLGFQQHILARSRSYVAWDASNRMIYVDSAGKLAFYPGVTSNINVIIVAGTGWHHIRVRHQGGKMRMYVDNIVQFDAAWSVGADVLSFPLSLGAVATVGYTNTLCIQDIEFRNL